MMPHAADCLASALRAPGTEVWVKHENHTPIGAFKARTAVVYAAELFRGPNNIKGLVTATRGNHGQSVALAARRFNVPAHVVVPRGNSAEKNTAMRAQGAESHRVWQTIIRNPKEQRADSPRNTAGTSSRRIIATS